MCLLAIFLLLLFTFYEWYTSEVGKTLSNKMSTKFLSSIAFVVFLMSGIFRKRWVGVKTPTVTSPIFSPCNLAYIRPIYNVLNHSCHWLISQLNHSNISKVNPSPGEMGTPPPHNPPPRRRNLGTYGTSTLNPVHWISGYVTVLVASSMTLLVMYLVEMLFEVRNFSLQ